MRNLDLDCPNCDTSVVKSYGNEVKLRTKLVKWTKDGMFAVCKSCSHEIAIDETIMRSIKSSFVYEVDVKKSVDNC